MDLINRYADVYRCVFVECADGWGSPLPATLKAQDDTLTALKAAIEALIKAEKALDAAEAWSPESYQPPPTVAELETLRATVKDLRGKIGLNQG